MNWASRAAVVLILAWLSIAYLHPGFSPVFQGDVGRVMSDGTDASTLPYQYGSLLEILRDRPAELFYGAVPARHLNAPQGFAMWIPWSERALVLLASAFTPLEHLSTVYAGLIMFLNAVLMYALGRRLGWPRALALGLAIAWAFSPFTRARAQVHVGFAGTYHVPLAMLSLMIALQGKTWRSLLLAGLGFLGVAMAPHYFVITLAFLSPFFLWAGWTLSGASGARPLWRTGLAVLPMLFLLMWFYFVSMPQDMIANGAAAHPPSGQTEGGGPHSFLTRFAAKPVDYLTGDIAFGYADVNPLREDLNREVLMTLRDSNPHERANGIRWCIWLIVGAGIFFWPVKDRRAQVAVAALGLFAFWLSLEPLAFGFNGPAYWLYSMVSQIRVPSRAGIYVHFAALLFAGLFLQRLIRQKPRFKYAAYALPLFVLLELPPYFQPAKMAQVRPPLTSLAGPACGTGIYFPYVAGNWAVLQSYYFLQEMRGTACDIVNSVWPDQSSDRLYRTMGISPEFVAAFNRQDPLTWTAITQTARCMPLSWIVFDPSTDEFARQALCRHLGWKMSEPRVCRREALPLLKKSSECL